MDSYKDAKKPKKRRSRFVGIIFTLIGLGFFAAGGALTYATYDFMNSSVETTGQVISVDVEFNDGSTTYSPTFAYLDDDGLQQQGKPFLSSSTYNFAIGTKMEILYDTRDNASVRLTSWFDTWGFGILFMAAGVVPLLIGTFVRKLGKNSPRKSGMARHKRIRDKYVRLESPESEEDHKRETNYEPTVRR